MKQTSRFLWLLLAACLTVLPLEARETEELCIQNGSRNIFGMLGRPDDGRAKHPLAIISHGFNGTHSFNYFPLFNRLGYMCYSFDFPCGSTKSRSDNNTVNMSVIDERDDLEAIINYFRARPDVDADSILLIGDSQGGLVSALAAARMPEAVSRLVLVYPALCIPDNWNSRYPNDGDIPDTTKVWGVPLGRRFFTEVRRMHVFDSICSFRGPVLIVQGDADPVVSLDDSRKAVARYADARLHVIRGARHGFRPAEQKEAHAEIERFLAVPCRRE